MKNLRFLTICGATMLLVACTKDDVATTASYEAIKAAQPTPVTFSTYMGEQAITRAGQTGAIVSDEQLETSGFGVFAYYTQGKPYHATNGVELESTAADQAPDFMYNQKVYTHSWTYSPLKYWPNDFNGNNGAVDARTDGSSASTGIATNYLSFFAYAPYVTVTPSSGTPTDASSGITALSKNSDTGNPTVTYQLSGTGNDVDLLWGTYNSGESSTSQNVLSTGNTANKVDGGRANVNINLQKQKTGGRVSFAFQHALSKVCFTVIADPDVVGNGTGDGIWNRNSNTGKTLITVNSLELSVTANDYGTGDNPATYAYTTATLDLAKGTWGEATGSNVTFEKTIAEYLDTSIKETTPSASDGSWAAETLDGVQASSATSVGDAADLFYLPGSKPVIKITITYTIRTADANLADGYSQVSQTISNKVSLVPEGGLVQGNKYTVNMKLGITGVKFYAEVSSWTNAADETPVNLPLNVSGN